MTDYMERKKGEERAAASLDKSKILSLSITELRAALLKSYEEQLEVDLRDQADVELLASFYAIETGWPRQRQERIKRTKALMDEILSQRPDYEYWSNSAYWTTREACALLCEFDPDGIKSGSMLEELYLFAGHNERIKRFFDYFRLLSREMNERRSIGDGSENADMLALGWVRLNPSDVIAWAVACAIPLPRGMRVNSPNRTIDVSEEDKGLTVRQANNYLRVIVGLAQEAKIEVADIGTAAKQMEQAAKSAGYNGPTRQTIRKWLSDLPEPD